MSDEPKIPRQVYMPDGGFLTIINNSTNLKPCLLYFIIFMVFTVPSFMVITLITVPVKAASTRAPSRV